MWKQQKGFSLIELIIVILVISIIAAIAVPNLLSARRNANEAAAISALRTIHQAEATYQISSTDGNFGTFVDLQSKGLLHEQLSNATTAANAKSGYIYTLNATPITAGENSVFDCDAQPVTHPSVSQFTATGSRRFFIIEAGAIYYNLDNSVISVASQTDRTISNGFPLVN